MAHLTLQVGGGLLEPIAQVAVIAALGLLLMMVIALGGYAYKSLRGDGIEWPEDEQEEGTEGVSRGTDDDEWDYY